MSPIEKPECGRQGSDEPTSHGEVSRTTPGLREHRNHGNSPARNRPGPGSNGLRPADKVVVLYLAIVAVLIASSYDRIEWWWLLVGLHLLVIASLIAVGRWFGPSASSLREQGLVPGPKGALLVVRSWYPLILIPLTYKELGYLIPLVHPHDFDRELALIDQRMLGLDPVIWLERFNYPVVTLIMQLSYLTYYIMPIVLGIVLWRARRYEDFEFFLFMVMLGFYTSYLGYIAVPAIGPRFFLSPGAARPLEGPGVGTIRSFLDQMEGVTRDCFPSGHTELTILVLFCAYRFHKKTFYVLLPAGSLLILSTVYLRYHYVIDVVAGAATAAVLAVVADRLYRMAGRLGVVSGSPSF